MCVEGRIMELAIRRDVHGREVDFVVVGACQPNAAGRVRSGATTVSCCGRSVI